VVGHSFELATSGIAIGGGGGGGGGEFPPPSEGGGPASLPARVPGVKSVQLR